MVQDSLGFLWFASGEGLHRYDGIEVITFRHDPLDSTSIGSNYIESMLLDSRGKLWLGCGGVGVSVFDPSTETCTHYRHDPEDSNTLSSPYVDAIAEDHQGFIWIGTPNGLNRLDPRTVQVRRFFHDPADPNSLSYNLVRSLYVDTMAEPRNGSATPSWPNCT